MDGQDSFPIGSIECTVLSDGWGDYPPEAIFPGVPEERWRPFAGTSLTEEGMIRLAYQQLLLRSGERLALVDAGLGDFGGPDGSAGKLPGSLAGLGISPDDIDVVLVSHAHPDHIGGLVRLGGPAPVPAFPNARVVMRQDEFEFWTSDASASMMEVMREVTGTVLPAIDHADQLDLVDDDREVFPGVRFEPAPGHTPGHAALLVSDDDQGAIYLGDALIHTAQFENPGWTAAFDALPEVTVESRRRLLELAASRDLTTLASHVAGRGRVRVHGAGFGWDPEG
jgi:glyoxylase-like metal-dependent hydrolase (beta-lactamase superfamily II)